MWTRPKVIARLTHSSDNYYWSPDYLNKFESLRLFSYNASCYFVLCCYISITKKFYKKNFCKPEISLHSFGYIDVI